MLDGILSRALEIIIVLDICGAVVYCLLSGMHKANKAAQHAPGPALAYGPSLEPCVAQGPAVPDWVRNPKVDIDAIYDEPFPEAAPLPERVGFVGGLKRKLTNLRGRFSYAPAPEGGIAKKDLGDEQNRLNRVLDSFREEA